MGLYDAVEDAIAAELLPKEIRGSGFGVLAVVTGLGDLISSVAVGCLWAAFGPRVALGCALVLMLLGASFMLHLGRKTSQP